jgi:hypothetical protein
MMVALEQLGRGTRHVGIDQKPNLSLATDDAALAPPILWQTSTPPEYIDTKVVLALNFLKAHRPGQASHYR